jgi:hypothetical protein
MDFIQSSKRQYNPLHGALQKNIFLRPASHHLLETLDEIQELAPTDYGSTLMTGPK